MARYSPTAGLAPTAGLVLAAPPATEAGQFHDERWSAPTATLFIVTSSLALWAGIFVIGSWLLG